MGGYFFDLNRIFKVKFFEFFSLFLVGWIRGFFLGLLIGLFYWFCFELFLVRGLVIFRKGLVVGGSYM